MKSVDLKDIEFEYLAEVQLPETSSLHLKMGHPKKETSIPTIHFQVLC